jgi:hypothetical protein
MDADFSIEIGPTAPALELPWSDPSERLQYIDLRRDPHRVDDLPEARQFPALRAFLLTMNAQVSPWQTAKCDVWSEPANSSENLYLAEFSQGSYVDVVLASRSALRDSLDFHKAAARRMASMLEEHESVAATIEIVVRRCYFHRESEAGIVATPNTAQSTEHEDANNAAQEAELSAADSDAGYCLTLFLTGWGRSQAEASVHWEQALELLSECLLVPAVAEERAFGAELG